ncbi:3'-5' exonuclease [Candidatus Peregrinibacteria bacterium]|nr:3'-5' exonuclease [Candidatus Peregrinibacteria bacterium]MBI3816056.1 3'-5' exonuclease [Candidatus Peregrinibacteria bacterium]
MAGLPPLTVFDVETTGLDPKRGHRIVEIAAMRFEGGSPLADQTFATFVNPERTIPFEARQVNTISDVDVESAPTIDVVLPQFLTFAEGSLLIAHNASFDYGFLEVEKQFCWGYVDLPECFCTLRLAQNLYPGDFRHNLDALCQKFKFTMPATRHRALADVILTAQALERMITDGHIRSLDELRRRGSIRQMVK